LIYVFRLSNAIVPAKGWGRGTVKERFGHECFGSHSDRAGTESKRPEPWVFPTEERGLPEEKGGRKPGTENRVFWPAFSRSSPLCGFYPKKPHKAIRRFGFFMDTARKYDPHGGLSRFSAKTAGPIRNSRGAHGLARAAPLVAARVEAARGGA
jgi:hypothetical protein